MFHMKHSPQNNDKYTILTDSTNRFFNKVTNTGTVTCLNKILSLLLFTLSLASASAQVQKDSICTEFIRTVQFSLAGSETQPPVLPLEGPQRLQLSFDELTDESHSFRYRISHCNANWEPDGLEPYQYLDGFEEGYINDFESSFTTLMPYMHYSCQLPATYTRFLISGNYLLTVTPDERPDSVLFTRRFWVTEQAIDATVTAGRASEGLMQNQEVSVTLDWNNQRSPRSGVIFQPQYIKVFVQQNGRLDNMRLMPFSNYSGSSLCYQWRPENIFPGGNTFRYFDISNLRATMYNVQRVETYGGEIFVGLRPDEDRSRKNYSPTESLNGGYKINARDRNNPTLESEYVWVNFSLPLERPYLGGGVYIVGALTDWLLNEESRMEWNPEYKAYTKRLELKQGYYAYQLIYRPFGDREGMTSTIEGDHYGTPNTYTAYIYYRGPNDMHDRLIAIRQVGSGQ